MMARIPTRPAWPILALLALLFALPAHAMTVERQENRLLIDGRPTPLLFARGVTDVAMLPAYRAMGFNTLFLRVDTARGDDLDRAEALAKAAEEAGLYLLIELATPDVTSPNDWSLGTPPHPRSEQYLDLVDLYAGTVVERLGTRPNLVGWVLGAVEDGRAISDLGTFADYLESKYRTIGALNKAWAYTAPGVEGPNTTATEPRLPGFEVLSPGSARQLATGNAQMGAKIMPDLLAFEEAEKARDADFRDFLKARYPALEELNRQWKFQFERWEDVKVEVILKRDRVQPGSSPQSLLELAQYRIRAAGELTELWARLVRELDHHAHPVFAGAQTSYRTMMTLTGMVTGVFSECYPTVAEPDLDAHNPHAIDIARRGNRFVVFAGVQPRGLDPRAFQNALYEAAVHGAMGIGVADFRLLLDSPDHARAFAGAARDLLGRGLLGMTPAPRTAIVLAPFAGGPPNAKRALFGYLYRGLSSGPNILLFQLRRGSTAGQFDFLTPADLATADLTRYTTLILPGVLDMPSEAQEALWRFVEGGGTAVADIGLGTCQATRDFVTLPQRMWELFGVEQQPGIFEQKLNLEVYSRQPLFPSLRPGGRSTGIADGYAILRGAAAVPFNGTDLLCATVPTNVWQDHDNRVRPAVTPNRAYCGIFSRQVGKGTAVYASFPLYGYWMHGTMLFEEFHRDLLAREAPAILTQPFEFLPSRAEIATYADGSVIVWSKNAATPAAKLLNPERRIYATFAGICEIGLDATRLSYKVGGCHIARAVPITLDRHEVPIDVTVPRYDATGITFTVDAVDGNYRGPLGACLRQGAYDLAPKSRHRVRIHTALGLRDEVLVASDDHTLPIDIPVAHARIEIESADPVLVVTPVNPGTEIAVVPIAEPTIDVTPVGGNPTDVNPIPVAPPKAPPTGEWIWGAG